MLRSDQLMLRIHVDPPLFGAVAVMCALGLVVLFSASDQSLDVLSRQSIRIGVGVIAMLAVAQVSPQTLQRAAPYLYVLGLGMLIAVLFVGVGRGSQRWLDLGLFRFQPSELMKLAVPLLVASIAADKILPPSPGLVGIMLAVTLVPAALIAKQPDLGTALLVAGSGLFVLFFAGISARFIRNSVLLAAAAAPLAWFSMHDYQRRRVLTLFNPEQDPLGAGYHIIQSTIAVGSGGLYGKGWLNGTQSHLEFLPERATDFIFAVYCEEFGLVGVMVLLLGYGLIVFRGFSVANGAQETFGRLFAAAITMTFVVYIFVNMGMVTGQLPVVGVPLPLISYGGTSLMNM